MFRLRYILILLTLWTACLEGALAQSDRQYIRSGNKLYREQNYAKAEVEYRKALARNARNAQAAYNLGCALLMQQKDSAAVQQLEQAGKLETAPMRKAMVYHNIGVACQKHQLYVEAIEAYKESLRHNPADHETRYNLALCMRLAKKQPQNKKQQDKNKQQDKDKKDKQQQKQQDKNRQKQQDKPQPQPKEQMSKENAEQLLNYAIQEEKATQQRMKQQQQQPQRQRLQKNW